MIALEQLYRGFISTEFQSRQAKNSSLSLRSFARSLELAPSTLSEILKGSHVPSSVTAERIARLTRWDSSKRKLFLMSAKLKRIKDPQAKKQLRADIEQTLDLRKTRELDAANSQIPSEWYDWAIAEWIQKTCAKTVNVKSICRAFTLKTIQVEQSFDRLIEAGILELDRKKSEWKVLSPSNSVRVKGGSLVVRRIHAGVMQRGVDALSADAPELRDFSSRFLRVNPEIIPQVAERFAKFRDEIGAFCREHRSDSDRIAAFSMQFFFLEALDS